MNLDKCFSGNEWYVLLPPGSPSIAIGYLVTPTALLNLHQMPQMWFFGKDFIDLKLKNIKNVKSYKIIHYFPQGIIFRKINDTILEHKNERLV
ncbi:MAG: hypothetical protein RUMPE_00916 [Eubacteriales bacterium SKADARSKE-1]|nr:hypothetical protein [Eubacteriales bacterium SKADARSKE-1]